MPTKFSAEKPWCTFGFLKSRSITNVFFPETAIIPAKFKATKVFPSPDTEEEMAITRASLLMKLILARILRIASAILLLEDSVTTT